VLAPVGPGAFVPLKMAIASADSVGNDVYVAVIVDFGNGSSMSTVSKCVPVPSNDHDADALAAAVGSDNVAYNNSGLLCAIDNYPSNGVLNCGQSVGAGNYDYWSYWHGTTGSWVYANNGPTEQSVSSSANDVMGLKFQMDEPDNASDPPPGVAAAYSQICNSSTEVPPAQSSSGAAPAQPSPTTTTAPASPATPTTGKTVTGAAQPTTTSTAVGRTRAKSGVPTATAAPGAATTTTLASGGTAPPRGGTHGSSGTHRSIVVSEASDHSGSGPSSNLLPVILIAVVVAALAGLAFFRWRRRPAEE
jgi:hypothetical protein